MIPQWASLDAPAREIFRATLAFLDKRLSEQGTLDWALRLEPSRRMERAALEDLLRGPRAQELAEPWATAWQLVEESWSNTRPVQRDSSVVFEIQRRLRTGDRSGAAIAAIVNLVMPRLMVEPIEQWRWSFKKKPRKPKVVGDILSARLTSGDLIDLDVLELSQLEDVPFLRSLATSLETAVISGLDIAHRLGWTEKSSFLGLGLLNRVYYTLPTRRHEADDNSEADAYHHGIAPSVKLLHAVVDRLSAIELEEARPFVARWRLNLSTVFVRLWSAMARDPLLASAGDVAFFLDSLTDRLFWDLNNFPEVAELRALRFHELDQRSQRAVADRIMKGPPRDHWPRKVEAEEVARYRRYWAVRELRRIEIADGVLPPRSKKWLVDQLPHFADLNQFSIDEGFPEAATARFVPPDPDRRFDHLKGIARLEALEVALATGRHGWNDDPAERANDWINHEHNAELLLADLEVAKHGGNAFPRIWSRFGWSHRPRQENGLADKELTGQAARVLVLLDKLSDATLSAAIDGISAWFDAWGKRAAHSPLTLTVWRRLWPLAVRATNGSPESGDETNLSVVAPPLGDDSEPKDLDTLNTPAGHLVGVFLSACPRLTPGRTAFAIGSAEREMRDTVVEAEGRSGLIAKHRLIEELRYFLNADREWAQQHLVTPLFKDDGAALALWRAVARRTHFTDVLKIIGRAMAERATDRRLSRETRRSLVFSLVVDSLYAFRDDRAPAVPNERLQQTLRMLDDEVRASAANAIQQFVRDLSTDKSTKKAQHKGTSEKEDDRPAAATLFRSAALPFLSQVWPREQSLTTPGVSRAFADLPATSGAAFAEAVNAIEPFLIPFDCWSMLDYGLFGDEDEQKRLMMIDTTEKATAFLRLLDLTIGSSDGAIVPYDLAEALVQISRTAPRLSTTETFRRLEAAARR